MANTVAPQWTTRGLLEWIQTHLDAKGVDEPALVARWLVAHAIGQDPIDLYTDLDRPMTSDERELLRSLVQRASEHEPVQYLLGEAGFLGRMFAVGPGVLVPRSATETLVELVLTWHRGLEPDARPDPLEIADIGTGTGCIAATLAMHLDAAHVLAVDSESEALTYARRNIERHGLVDRIDLVQGDLLDPLDGVVHVLVSNPPYISDGRFAAMASNVREYEPSTALRAGADGLDVVRRLISDAPGRLHEGGLLVIEIDDCHGADVLSLAGEQASLVDARIVTDEFGDDRFLVSHAQ